MNLSRSHSSETVRQAIYDLKSFDIITAMDIAHVLLVMHDVKPSMLTGFFSDLVEINHDIPKSYSEDKKKFGDILINLGLIYKIQTRVLKKEIDGKQFHYEWVVYCIAKETRVAEALFDARERNDDRQEGLLLGYPESAVEAFVNDDMIDISKVPESTPDVTLEEMKFLNHRLSKDNWKEEIKYLPSYARALKNIDLQLYEECISL